MIKHIVLKSQVGTLPLQTKEVEGKEDYVEITSKEFFQYQFQTFKELKDFLTNNYGLEFESYDSETNTILD